jgi:hypothetical protein
MTIHKKAVASLTTGHGSSNTSGAYYSKPENNSTAAAQRQAIYKHLAAGNTLTALFARERMGICELRKSGYAIITNWRVEQDVTGRDHKIAEYALFTGSEVQS